MDQDTKRAVSGAIIGATLGSIFWTILFLSWMLLK